MLLKEIKQPFNSDDYVFELKFDGIRGIIFASPKEIKIQSRNGSDLTQLFPELQKIKSLVHTNTIFDGEIVALDGEFPSFEKIQKRIHIKDAKKIKDQSIKDPIVFIVFDILYEKKDLTMLTLIKRKEILEKYHDEEYFIKTKMLEKKGKDLFQKVKKLGLEGIVAKKKKGLYYINERTDECVKIKNIQRDEFYIGGYEKKKNDLLSLAVGEFVDNSLHFVGKVKISPQNKVYKEILNQRKTKNYFCDFDEKINYVKPTITCHISYLERTKKNHLRHPIYKDMGK